MVQATIRKLLEANQGERKQKRHFFHPSGTLSEAFTEPTVARFLLTPRMFMLTIY